MISYENKEIEIKGCPGCAYAKHQFDVPCGIAYENERFILSQDWEVPILGFFIVSPKKHIEKLEELTKNERDEMFDIVDKTIKILTENKEKTQKAVEYLLEHKEIDESQFVKIMNKS